MWPRFFSRSTNLVTVAPLRNSSLKWFLQLDQSFVLLHNSLTIRDAAHFRCFKKLRLRNAPLASHPQLFGTNSELFPKILFGRLSL